MSVHAQALEARLLTASGLERARLLTELSLALSRSDPDRGVELALQACDIAENHAVIEKNGR